MRALAAALLLAACAHAPRDASWRPNLEWLWGCWESQSATMTWYWGPDGEVNGEVVGPEGCVGLCTYDVHAERDGFIIRPPGGEQLTRTYQAVRWARRSGEFTLLDVPTDVSLHLRLRAGVLSLAEHEAGATRVLFEGRRCPAQ